MGKAEEYLWNELDEHGIAFRSSQAKLIETYGHRNCGWTSDLAYCEVLGTRPFIDGLAHPLVFQFQPTSNLFLRPDNFFGYVRLSENAEENFRHVEQELASRYGEGVDISVSNTTARRWNFGRASIEAVAFPSSLNKHHVNNARHRLIAGSETECSLFITPAWFQSLSSLERVWLDSYTPILKTSLTTSSPIPSGPLVRELNSELPFSELGFGLCRADQALAAFKIDGLVEILPLEWAINLCCWNILPARGSGSSILSIRYETPEQPGTKLELQLATSGKPHAFDKIAKRLEADLTIPLEMAEYLDV